MKKNILLTLCAILVLLSAGAYTVTPPPIVVTYDRITIDSKVGGGFWAYGTFHSTVTITQTGVNQYQLVWVDTGTFVSWAGASPNATGTIGNNVTGTITGGQTMTVNGVLKSSLPSYLGSYDLNCDHFANCPDYVSWRTLLFDSISSASYVQWGWTYTTCGNGTWVNADIANTGDITGDPVPCPTPPEAWKPLSTKAYLTLTFSPSGGFINRDSTPGSHGCFLMVRNGSPSDSVMNSFCGANPDDISEIPMLSGRIYQRYPGDLRGVWKDNKGNNLDDQLKIINQEHGWRLRRMAFFTSVNPLKGGLWWIDHLMYP